VITLSHSLKLPATQLPNTKTIASFNNNILLPSFLTLTSSPFAPKAGIPSLLSDNGEHTRKTTRNTPPIRDIPTTANMSSDSDPERSHALSDYKAKLLDSREWEAKLKELRLQIKGLQHDFDVSEDNIKALQSVGQIIGEVLKQLDEERCK